MTNEELVAQLDQRFDRLDQRFERIDQRFERIDQRFERIDQRFERIDQRFERIDQRFDQLEERMDGRFAQVDARFVQVDEHFAGIDRRLGTLGEDVHQTRIVVEDFDRQVGLLQDGIQNVDDKLGRFRDETDKNFTELRDRMILVEARRR